MVRGDLGGRGWYYSSISELKLAGHLSAELRNITEANIIKTYPIQY